MATFRVILDNRNKLRNGRFNLVLRIFHKNDFLDLKITKMTKKEYDFIFKKNSLDDKSIEFRKKCNELKIRGEKIFKEVGYLNKELIRNKFYKTDPKSITSLKLKDLFSSYIKLPSNKYKTQTRIRYSSNTIEKFKPNMLVTDINPKVLKEFEKHELNRNISIATISSILIDLRTVINYYTKVERVIPQDYEYPFGKGKYSIRTSYSTKAVLTLKEIEKVLYYDCKGDEKMSFAKDMWEFVFRCNGINFIDVFLLKREYIKNSFISFQRRKTIDSRKKNIKNIDIPITHKIERIINKWGDPTNLYVFGLMIEGLTENQLYYRLKNTKDKINDSLDELTAILNLSVPLKLGTGRETYATHLLRSGRSKDEIGEMLGHSNSKVTEHYLAGLEIDHKRRINSVLPK